MTIDIQPLPSCDARPTRHPASPHFSSGPCAKRPGWSLAQLERAVLGRSHRSKVGKARLGEAITRTRQILEIPDDYRIGIVPGSDTGAFEMAMWTMLGGRGVDLLAWESFGAGWVSDVVKQLRLDDVRCFEADYGALPDLHATDRMRDIVFAWNGTTSGVCVPDGDWIFEDREGLTLCDATSAAFAMRLPWSRLDVTTFSWQKVMGGEAAHGMLILSPRAVEHLESYTPSWPVPKVFRLTKGGKLLDGIFRGETINTPSMLAVEDYIDALSWAESIGGLGALCARVDENFATLANWERASDWATFLCAIPAHCSPTSVCFKINAPKGADSGTIAKTLVQMLEDEDVAYDIGAYRDAPAGLRIWAGATVARDDLETLTDWLDWAYTRTISQLSH